MKQLRRFFAFFACLLFAAGCDGSLFLSEGKTAASKQRRVNPPQLSTKTELASAQKGKAVPLDSPLRTTVPPQTPPPPDPPLLKPTELTATKEPIRLASAPVPLDKSTEEARIALSPVPLTPATEEEARASDPEETSFSRLEKAGLALSLSDLDSQKEEARIALPLAVRDRSPEEAALALPLAARDRSPEPVRLAQALTEKPAADISAAPLALTPDAAPTNNSLKEEAGVALNLESAQATLEEAPLAVPFSEKEPQRSEEAALALQLSAAPFTDKQPGPLLQTDLNMKPVFFDVDSSELLEEGLLALNENIKQLESYPYRFNYIVLEGHCDPLGSESYNLKLGRDRAEAVKQYLQDHGIPDELLVTVSYGETRLLSEADDAQNRRVSFTVIH